MTTDRWVFSKERLAKSPSRQHDIDEEKESVYLQWVANCIQDMGRELSLPLLCINTAVLYTQRFYVFHSLTTFEKFSLGASALFLAAKVEEHPRKVDDLCRVARKLGIIERGVSDDEFFRNVFLHESIILPTLGFELKVQHPHQHVLLLCEFLKASKHLAQTSYILATYCLHLTKMCLANKPTVIACVCIHTAAKMLCVEVPQPNEDKVWYLYADNSVTPQLLEELTIEFVRVLKKCPDNFKNRTLTNLVKKLVIDPTFIPTLKSSSKSASCVPSPKVADESYADGITFTLQEELSLITSSLSCESQSWKCEVPVNKVESSITISSPTVSTSLTQKEDLKVSVPMPNITSSLSCESQSWKCEVPVNTVESSITISSPTVSTSLTQKEDLKVSVPTPNISVRALPSFTMTKTDVIQKTLKETNVTAYSKVTSRDDKSQGSHKQISLLKKHFIHPKISVGSHTATLTIGNGCDSSTPSASFVHKTIASEVMGIGDGTVVPAVGKFVTVSTNPEPSLKQSCKNIKIGERVILSSSNETSFTKQSFVVLPRIRPVTTGKQPSLLCPTVSSTISYPTTVTGDTNSLQNKTNPSLVVQRRSANGSVVETVSPMFLNKIREEMKNSANSKRPIILKNAISIPKKQNCGQTRSQSSKEIVKILIVTKGSSPAAKRVKQS